MDFHSLSRRELQVLCKRNNIPANVTNAAMADSLKTLDNVEGIDELLQVYESVTAQYLSSIEPGIAPLTGSRSIRRRNAETLVAPQTKMDPLKDCAQNDPSLTPAPLGVMSRRRRAVTKDSGVKSVCGTRRSARLAEKSARLKGVVDGNPDFSKKGLFADDCPDELKVNSKECQGDLDEMSGVTDLTESTNLEENSERKDDEQVDSSEKQDIATDAEGNRYHSVIEGGAKTEVKEHFEKTAHVEVVPCEKEIASAVEEVDLVPKTQEIKGNQSGTDDEAESEPKEGSFVETNERVVGAENLDIPGVDAIAIVAENSEQKQDEEVVPCESVLAMQEENGNHSEADDDDAKTEPNDINVEIEQEGFVSEIDSEFDDVQASETNIEVKDTISVDASALTKSEGTFVIYECKASSTIKETMVAAVASDNKENIGSESKSGTKIVDRAISEVDEMVQLSKMFNEVSVTPKLDKNKSENEVATRSALQVLPRNQEMN